MLPAQFSAWRERHLYSIVRVEPIEPLLIKTDCLGILLVVPLAVEAEPFTALNLRARHMKCVHGELPFLSTTRDCSIAAPKGKSTRT